MRQHGGEEHKCATRDITRDISRQRNSGVRTRVSLFDGHVSEFSGFEDVTAVEALNKFRVLLASHDSHMQMLAWFVCGYAWQGRLSRWQRLTCIHIASKMLRNLRHFRERASIVNPLHQPCFCSDG